MYKSILAGMVFAASAASVSAMEVEVDLSNPDDVGFNFCGGSCPYALSYEYDLDGTDMTASVTGWSYNYNDEINMDWVGNWSSWGTEYGLGVEYDSSPNHAIDNYLGDYDMLLIEFSQAVELTGVEAGWRGHQFGSIYGSGRPWNSEVSLLAYQGDDFSGFGSGQTWDGLLSESWAHAGDTRIMNLNQTEQVNAGGLVSQYWLVGAYNSTLGGTDYFTDGNDFFKLTSISAQVNPVPLPGSMLMFGLALLGAGAYRRRRKV